MSVELICKYYNEMNNGDFKCNEPNYKNGFCKFHLEGYLTESTKSEIEKLFIKKVIECHDQKLYCVGFNLPSLDLLNNLECVDCEIYFDNAIFNSEINVSDVVFKKNISFWHTNFRDNVNFNHVIFEKNVNFSHCIFDGNVLFSSTKFQKSAIFLESKFKKESEFDYSVFTQSTFKNAEFEMDVSFFDVLFYEIIFNHTKFFKSVNFKESNFLSLTKFEKTKFMKFADFSHVNFSKHHIIKFNTDLSNVSFIDTDIKSINFGTNTSWNSNKSNKNRKTIPQNTCCSALKFFMFKINIIILNIIQFIEQIRHDDKYVICEEMLLFTKQISDLNSLESIKNIYRDLRDNFDRNLQYDIAGEFFIKEMELTRRFKQKNNKIQLRPIIHRLVSLYAIYNLLGLYGQSYKRPSVWIIVLISSAFSIFLYEEYSASKMFTVKIIYEQLIKALSILIPFNIQLNGNNIFDNLFKIISLPMSAILFIALKRKLERKLRH